MRRAKRAVLYWNDGRPLLVTRTQRRMYWPLESEKERARTMAWEFGILFVDGSAPTLGESRQWRGDPDCER